MWENTCNAHIMPTCGVRACLTASPRLEGHSDGAVRAPRSKDKKQHRESRQYLASKELRSQGVASPQAPPKSYVERQADVDRTLILEKGELAWQARRTGRQWRWDLCMPREEYSRLTSLCYLHCVVNALHL